MTILLDKDINYLGIDVRSLKRAERDIGGIGGLISTYVVEDATLFLRTEDGEIIEEKLQLQKIDKKAYGFNHGMSCR